MIVLFITLNIKILVLLMFIVMHSDADNDEIYNNSNDEKKIRLMICNDDVYGDIIDIKFMMYVRLYNNKGDHCL